MLLRIVVVVKDIFPNGSRFFFSFSWCTFFSYFRNCKSSIIICVGWRTGELYFAPCFERSDPGGALGKQTTFQTGDSWWLPEQLRVRKVHKSKQLLLNLIALFRKSIDWSQSNKCPAQASVFNSEEKWCPLKLRQFNNAWITVCWRGHFKMIV